MKYRLAIITVLLIIIGVLIANKMRVARLTTVPGDGAPTSFTECARRGNPIAESYPRQCRTPDGTVFIEEVVTDAPTQRAPTMTVAQAEAAARASEACTEVGALSRFETYNPNSGTWWFSLDATRQGCTPACVVADATGAAELNWRCTGLAQ